MANVELLVVEHDPRDPVAALVRLNASGPGPAKRSRNTSKGVADAP